MLKQYLTGLFDIVYPKRCLVCKTDFKKGSVDGIVCFSCWDKIKLNLPPFCASCGRSLKPGYYQGICFQCQKKNLHFDRAFSPCAYEGVLKELIHQFKYRDKAHLGVTLSKVLIKFIKEYNLPVDLFDLIVPVPLHNIRMREREFNQAELLSEGIAAEFNKTVSRGNLIRVKDTKSQASLDETSRFKNVLDSFVVKDALEFREKFVILVDDVLTTGATCSQAALSLKQAGAKVVFVFTLAS